MRGWRGIGVLFTCGAALFAQRTAFEAVSVKPVAPPNGRVPPPIQGGPGSNDPGRWTCRFVTLDDLLKFAFRLKPYELSAPAWTRDLRFDIEAKVPDGASVDDLHKMAAHLLEERFGLQFHREAREMPVFHLVVAKGGPRLTESGAAVAVSSPTGLPRLTVDPNGYPKFPPGQPGQIVLNGMGTWQAVGESMDTVAAYVSGHVHRPVLNYTGLQGKYDFVLNWAIPRPAAAPPAPAAESSLPAPEEGGPPIATAIQEQLGLKLESRKGTIDVLVVDRLEKTPTEN